MEILKNTYNKQQKENKDFSGTLSHLLKNKVPSRKTIKRHNKDDVQSFLKNYSSENEKIPNNRSEDYSIPEIEREKDNSTNVQLPPTRKNNNPQMVEMDEKLSRILTLISPETNYHTSNNDNRQNHNVNTTNNFIEKYYLSGPNKLIENATPSSIKEKEKSERNNFFNSLVEKNNTLENNSLVEKNNTLENNSLVEKNNTLENNSLVEKNNTLENNSLVEKNNTHVLQKTNPASLINKKLIKYNTTNQTNQHETNFHKENNTSIEESNFHNSILNDSENYNVKFIPQTNKNNITKIHKDIDVAKVLNNTSNSYEYLPALKDGGVVTEATKVVVGEKGPEAIVPLDQMNNVMNQKFQNVQNYNKNITTSASESMTKNIFLKMNEETVKENIEKQKGGGLNVSSVQPNFSMGNPGGGQQGGPPPSGGGGRKSIDPLTLSLLRKTSLPPWRSSFG
jgi:hypothetical protein